MTPTSRSILFACLLAVAAAAHADPAHDLPACADFPAPAPDWTRAEERGFSFALPPGARPEPRGPSLDHEFGRWTWSDERQLYFQYGFAVTELAGWLELPFVTGCRASLDSVDAVFLERRQPDGQFVWAIGLFDYVRSYNTSSVSLGLNSPNDDDLVLIGAGRTESIFAQGRALFGSFRWSRLPRSALAAWSVRGASNNGVLVFETENGATAVMIATYRDGNPYWLVGTPPGPVISHVSAKTEFDGGDVRAASVPLTLYETSAGVTPGSPDRPAQLTPIADAEFTISLSDRCQRARLRWLPRAGGTMQTWMLTATYPPLHGCTTYRE